MHTRKKTPNTRIPFCALASFLLVASAAKAQMYTQSGEDPRAEYSNAIVGNTFLSYRNAIAQRRRGTSQPSVRQDSSEAPTWNGISSLWTSVDTKQINGTYSGNSTNLIVGVDALLGGSFVVGLIAGYNDSSVDVPAGQRIKADGFSVGPYFSARLSDRVSLDGFIGIGNPDYNIDGGRFSGDKTFGNLTLSGSVPLETVELSPFISLAAVREELPAFSSTVPVVAYAATDIDSFVATVGTGIHFDAINRGNLTYLPNAGVEIDYVRNDDGFGNDISFTTPRISGGLTVISDAGAINIGANLSHTSEGTTTIGASAAYFWQF